MKTLLALALLSTTAFADTLIVTTPNDTYVYTGKISDLDKEDSIKQVEINDATVTITMTHDEIFYDGFELINPNWIWIGDDTSDNEFGYSARCTESDYKDSSGALNVYLTCTHVHNSETRPVRP